MVETILIAGRPAKGSGKTLQEDAVVHRVEVYNTV